MKRRDFLITATALPLWMSLPGAGFAQARTFTPTPGRWRRFELVTRLEIAEPAGATQAWIPMPALNNDWQISQQGRWTGNASETTLVTDPTWDAAMVHARWAEGEKAPWIETTTEIRTQDRRHDWTRRGELKLDRTALAQYLKPTEYMPTDGIVARTAQEIVGTRRSDIEKVRSIYDWVVQNTYREPSVRGCGVGDIKAMLETGNLGGKCGDINALFVGLARAVGVPARDVYGIRVARSAFGYRELGAGSADVSKAQHCRAEVWLDGRGWVAMDPADVGKVMRQETPEWLKDPRHPVVAPVNAALFGGWEGNWVGYNVAHDVALPGSKGAKLPFFMYPQAETRGERVDSLDPETFRYRITTRELA